MAYVTTLGRVPTGCRAVAVASAALALASIGAANAASASEVQPLPTNTRFYTPKVDPGAKKQIVSLIRTGHWRDATQVGRMVTTPQAVWFTKGTPKSVKQDVRRESHRAGKRRVPTFVIYNVPDCSQYSSGGAGGRRGVTRAWVDGFAAGLIKGQRITVVVEPDGLANLPSDGPAAYPGQDIDAITTGRIADIHYAGVAMADT